jgi:hypothetical protein
MTKRQTKQWPKHKQQQLPKDRQYNNQNTDNTMTKTQTTQWPKDRQHNDQNTDNTMTKTQKEFKRVVYLRKP